MNSDYSDSDFENSPIDYITWKVYVDTYNYCVNSYNDFDKIIKVIRHHERTLNIPEAEQYKLETSRDDLKLTLYSFEEFNEFPDPEYVFNEELNKVNQLENSLFKIRMRLCDKLHEYNKILNLDLSQWHKLNKFIEDNNL